MIAWKSLTLCTGLFLVALATQVSATEQQRTSILDGSVAVQAEGWSGYTVKVDMGSMFGPRIVGHVTATGGTGNDVDVNVFTESDFLNWKNGHDTHPLFTSGRVTAADLDVPIEQSGTYYVVLSNTFSTLTPKTVEGHLALTWTPSKAKQSAENAQVAEGMALIVALLVATAALGGLVVWFMMSRKKKDQTPAAGA